jgi:hypothetical protein
MAMTTVLTQTTRQGTVWGNALAWQAGTLTCTAQGLLDDADAGNPANMLKLAIEGSFDGGVTWTTVVGPASWQGGSLPHGATSGPPWALPTLQVGYVSSGQTPTHVRPRLELPSSLSIGATVAFA